MGDCYVTVCFRITSRLNIETYPLCWLARGPEVSGTVTTNCLVAVDSVCWMEQGNLCLFAKLGGDIRAKEKFSLQICFSKSTACKTLVLLEIAHAHCSKIARKIMERPKQYIMESLPLLPLIANWRIIIAIMALTRGYFGCTIPLDVCSLCVSNLKKLKLKLKYISLIICYNSNTKSYLLEFRSNPIDIF